MTWTDPYRYLSYTWHTFTPEWAKTVGVSEEVRAKLAAEQKSKVIFEIEPAGELVKLTVMPEPGAAHTLAGHVQPGLARHPVQPQNSPGNRRATPRSPGLTAKAAAPCIKRSLDARQGAPRPMPGSPLPGRASKRASKCPMRLG